MIVLTELGKTHDEDPARHFHFSDFAARTADVLFIAGWFDHSVLNYISGKPVWYLDLEEPNTFFSRDFIAQRGPVDDRIDRIFSICPYTCEWLNRREGNERRTPVFFPFPARYVPQRRTKQFDVIYTGHLSPGVMEFVQPMLAFNHCIVSQRQYSDLDRLVTHVGVGHREKLELAASSRVAVVHNLLFPGPSHIEALKELVPDAAENAAFSQIFPSRGLTFAPAVPQLKSRLFEAAFCRALILCAEDDWNVVERYFRPGRDFIYFKRGHLKETLDRVLTDFRPYEDMVESAFRHAMAEYTTEAFAERYLTGLPQPVAKARATLFKTQRRVSRGLARLWQR